VLSGIGEPAPNPQEEREAVDARVIAFYLPQYHTIPENDLWWGEGFTDWTNVRRAKPQFPGHDQPRVPTSLGYYDLRNVDTHHAQAALARAHGVAAFCYYAYWFGGRRLLEEPLEIVGANPDLAMPYVICWANEPWSRRWDGSEAEVLMAQQHHPKGDAALIDDLSSHLADPRYLRIDGRPLLLVYRASLLVDPVRTTDGLRERARRLGLGDLYLAMVQSFDDRHPEPFGFDAAVEFPPHGLWPRQSVPSRVVAGYPGFRGSLLDYQAVAASALSKPAPPYPWFRGVMPAWDNTPRRGQDAKVFIGSSSATFGAWIEEALRFTYTFGRASERLVFINAWNEWAEGAYLEPDVSNQDGNLVAVENALRSTRGFALEVARMANGGGDDGARLEALRRGWRSSAVRPMRSDFTGRIAESVTHRGQNLAQRARIIRATPQSIMGLAKRAARRVR